MKKLFCLATLLAFTASSLNAQNFEVSVSGIKEGDSIRLIVQQSKEYLFQQWVSYSSEGSSLAIFDNLTEGQWALSIDATGYTFPTASVFNFPEITEENIGLTTNTKEVPIETGTIYYWSVITSDGSISVNSDVFSFRVD